jgi:alpha-galactosidase
MPFAKIAGRSAALLLCSMLPWVASIDNGLGLTPPMGWRSWNCYQFDISDEKMRGVIDAMTSKSRTVDGKPSSLLDVGYLNCGIDDGWYVSRLK